MNAYKNMSWGLGHCDICKAESVNVGRNLCAIHLDDYRAYRSAELKVKEMTLRLKNGYRYYLDSEDFGSVEDSPIYLGYSVSGCGATVEEFLESVEIAEIDQDGGDRACYGFQDASSKLQDKILSYTKGEKGYGLF